MAFQSSSKQKSSPSVLAETVGVIIVMSIGSFTSWREEFHDLFSQRSDIESELVKGEEL